jgi:acetyltransferase-like isoleucine patch superfamily enzyme
MVGIWFRVRRISDVVHSLNQFARLRRVLVRTKWLYLTRIWRMDLDPSCEFSLSARFDKTYPRGVHVGPESYIAFEAAILAHDMTRGLYLHTRIGRRCFIGARSIVMPGVEIGDECVVGSGSVVIRSVPPRCMVAGNPAKIIREGIKVGCFGRLEGADETHRRLVEEGAFP